MSAHPTKDTIDSANIDKILTSLDEYVQFGRSGLRVSPVALGTMTFGANIGFGADFEESRKVFDHYYEQGGNFVDTANVYSNGDSERYLGDLISDRRSSIVLGSKYSLNTKVGERMVGLPSGRPNPNAGGNSRCTLVESIDASLKRLRTGSLDILYMHVYDWSTPIEETMRALDDVVRAGKAHYIAVSGSPSWVVARANTLAELRGWTQFIGLQTKYSLLERSYEYDLLPVAAEFQMATVPWGILESGFLTGKYDRAAASKVQVTNLRTAKLMGQITNSRSWTVLDELKAIAQEIGRTPAQVATNWTLQRPGITSILTGARTVDQLKDNLLALEFTLSPEQIARLDAVSMPDPSCVPFAAREIMHGGWDQVFQAGQSKPAPRFWPTLGY